LLAWRILIYSEIFCSSFLAYPIPAYFCAATETGWDIIDLLLREQVQLPAHPLETVMAPKETPKTSPPNEEHTSIGVYVDDFVLGLVENNVALPTVTHYAGTDNILADTASRSFASTQEGNPPQNGPQKGGEGKRPNE
jgi:hypothetical protein